MARRIKSNQMKDVIADVDANLRRSDRSSELPLHVTAFPCASGDRLKVTHRRMQPVHTIRGPQLTAVLG